MPIACVMSRVSSVSSAARGHGTARAGPVGGYQGNWDIVRLPRVGEVSIQVSQIGFTDSTGRKVPENCFTVASINCR